MKNKIAEIVLSPNIWAGIASVLASIGLIAFTLGHIWEIELLSIIGVVLFTPLVAGGILLILVVIPILVIANYRLRDK